MHLSTADYLPEEKYWEPLTESLFHFFLSGNYQCFAWFFVCLLFAAVCCFCPVWFSLFSIWCTRSSFIPRLSPSSWWAQHWSKKKCWVGLDSVFCGFFLSHHRRSDHCGALERAAARKRKRTSNSLHRLITDEELLCLVRQTCIQNFGVNKAALLAFSFLDR